MKKYIVDINFFFVFKDEKSLSYNQLNCPFPDDTIGSQPTFNCY